MREPKVTILMATYNGGRYLRQQLDSLINQTYTNWELIIRDDGSLDDTWQIAETYAAKRKNISLLKNRGDRSGACANFSALFDIACENPDVQYIMFCDQDDIWKPEKIEQSVDTILLQEKVFHGQPVLVYSDLELMDEQGRTIPGSLKLKQQIELRTLISFNYVYGCTTIMNRALMSKIGHIPEDAANHDYWIALIASIYHSFFLDRKLIRYRQHDSNASGNLANNNSWHSRIKRQFLAPSEQIKLFRSLLFTLDKFLKQFRNEMAPGDVKLLLDYLRSFKVNRIRVCYAMLTNRIFRTGILQSIAPFYQVLVFYRNINLKNT